MCWNWDIVRTFPGAGEWKFLKWISGVPTQPPTETRYKAEEAPPPCFSKENNRMWTVNGTGETTLEWVPTANTKLLQLSVASSGVRRLREPAAAKETPCGHLRNCRRKPGTTTEFKKKKKKYLVDFTVFLMLSWELNWVYLLFFKKKVLGHIPCKNIPASFSFSNANCCQCHRLCCNDFTCEGTWLLIRQKSFPRDQFGLWEILQRKRPVFHI